MCSISNQEGCTTFLNTSEALDSQNQRTVDRQDKLKGGNSPECKCKYFYNSGPQS